MRTGVGNMQLPDKICPRCKQLVEVHIEGWFYDHNTKKGNSCGMSGATAYMGKKLEELQNKEELKNEQRIKRLYIKFM